VSPDPLAEYVSKAVVVDTDADILYIGTLVEISETAIAMEEVDVHSMRDTAATREVYVMETAKYGVRANRKHVSLMRSRVISVSLLDDVVKY
jgi:hypothetical protein